MKTPPQNAEFSRFTNAMRDLLKVSKMEIQRRIEVEKKEKQIRASVSPASVASPKKARQN